MQGNILLNIIQDFYEDPLFYIVMLFVILCLERIAGKLEKIARSR